MRAIIIDDEKNNRENLSSLLTQYCPEVELCGEAASVDEAFILVRQLKPDLVFLDIKMPEKDGFELLETLDEVTFEVIIVTAYNQYALKALKFSAIDYLLKPIDIIELSKAVDKAASKISEKKESNELRNFIRNMKSEPVSRKIALPNHEQVDFVSVSEIIRCEGDNNYTHVYLHNGTKKLVSKTLKEFDELLQEYYFIRIHRSHLVNPDFITSYYKNDGGIIHLSDGARIPVSRSRKKEVLEMLKKL